MKTPTGKLTGYELEKHLADSIDYHLNIFQSKFKEYEPKSLYKNWSLLIRCIDEIINIPFEIKDKKEKQDFLDFEFEIGNQNCLYKFKKLNDFLTNKFGLDVAERFKMISMMCFGIHKSFEINGIYEQQGGNLSLSNTKNCIDYFQSRRMYYVTVLNLIPKIAKGENQSKFIDLLNQFQYIIDSCLVGITSAYHRLLINKCICDFEIVFDGKKGVSNFSFNQLENFFLDPQQLSLIDQLELRKDIFDVKGLLGKSKSKIFSFSEVADTMTFMKCAFEKYNIENLEIFKELNLFFYEISSFITEDYNVVINDIQFNKITKKFPSLNLFIESDDYFKVLNSYVPFQRIEDNYYSTVVLLVRFTYITLSYELMKNKSFQINSGFVFEDRIKMIIESKGFIDTKITRINRKEFDVVAIKNNKIYNFQCKNNYYDISSVYNNTELIARLNNRLCKYYEKALNKEKLREELLVKKIGIDSIEHFVVSRFPVISQNKNIINFNDFDSFINNYAC